MALNEPREAACIRTCCCQPRVLLVSLIGVAATNTRVWWCGLSAGTSALLLFLDAGAATKASVHGAFPALSCPVLVLFLV
jgi:hypothetical protein